MRSTVGWKRRDPDGVLRWAVALGATAGCWVCADVSAAAAGEVLAPVAAANGAAPTAAAGAQESLLPVEERDSASRRDTAASVAPAPVAASDPKAIPTSAAAPVGERETTPAGATPAPKGEAPAGAASPVVEQPGAASSGGARVREVKGIRATEDIVRGVLAGGAVRIQLAEKLSLGANPRVKLHRIPNGKATDSEASTWAMQIQGIEEHDGKHEIVATVPPELEQGTYEVSVLLPQNGVEEVFARPQQLRVKPLWWAVAIACAPVVVVAILVGLLLRHSRGREEPQRSPSLWSLILMEPENRTYSLSRAQFVMWSAAITCTYVFIFVARGVVENKWAFPPLAGFGATFLMSLGTLVAAQATSRVVGVKGADQPEPALADLVLHGGVVALERVQQLLWTFIAIGMFLFIAYTSYTTATRLPEVPDELLTLMGISAGGYLAGKMARSPGPVIGRVQVSSGSVVLTIEGKRLSKDAVVLVDNVRPKEPPAVTASDLDHAGFAKALTVKFADSTTERWKEQPHSITIINADCQRAEWRSKAAITDTEFVSHAGGQLELRVETEYAGEVERWESIGHAQLTDTPKRDGQRPRVFIFPISAEVGHRSGQLKAITTRGESMEAFWTAALPKQEHGGGAKPAPDQSSRVK